MECKGYLKHQLQLYRGSWIPHQQENHGVTGVVRDSIHTPPGNAIGIKKEMHIDRDLFANHRNLPLPDTPQ